jgi:hypothetical protein
MSEATLAACEQAELALEEIDRLRLPSGQRPILRRSAIA